VFLAQLAEPSEQLAPHLALLHELHLHAQHLRQLGVFVAGNVDAF